uniref:Uncharacterized protein n=1 Tax=Arundo donax TaxID=35708 RepID=A0A0A9B5C7_ARUDO
MRREIQWREVSTCSLLDA